MILYLVLNVAENKVSFIQFHINPCTRLSILIYMAWIGQFGQNKKARPKKAKRIPIGLARKGARPFSKMTFPGVCAISEVGGFHVSGLAATHWQLQTFLASMRRSSKVKHL